MKFKKRLLTCILCVIAVVILSVCLVSCNKNKDCDHTYGDWTTVKEATCTESGLQTRKCSKCEQTEEKSIDSLGHNWADATCQAPKTCTRCSETEGNKLEHNFDKEIVSEKTLKSSANCINPAYYYKSCACGEVSKSENDVFASGEANGHSFVLEIAKDSTLKSEADCINPAYYYKSCACGEISHDEKDVFASGSATEHKFTEEVVKADALKSEATCENAYIYYKSCKCGMVSTSEADTFVYGEKAKHNYTLEIVTEGALKSEADCINPAYYYKSCTCGAISSNETDVFTSGSSLGHKYIENPYKHKDATCTEAEVKVYECTCGDYYEETVGSALGHNIKNVEPTRVLVEGESCKYVLVYVCQNANCGEEVQGEYIYNHVYIASITKPATCKENGEKTLTCTCGDSKKEVIEKSSTGHIWVTGSTFEGKREDKCSVCGEKKTVIVYEGNSTDSTNAGNLKDTEIEVGGTNISLDDGTIDKIGDKDITLSADKLTSDDLGDLNISDDKLAQVGNSPIYNFTINDGNQNISDFGEDNWVTITLPYELSEGEDVDSIAIWYISEGSLVSIKATYSNGYVTFKTNHFSYYTVTRLTPAERCELYGHSYTTQHINETCTSDGYDLLVCVRCHDRKKENIVSATGHNYEIADSTEATCTADGKIIYRCQNDGCNSAYTKKIPATGHDYEITDSTEATCTENGYAVYKCNNCEHSYTDTYAKKSHSVKSQVINATCTTDGYTLYECENCDYSQKGNFVKATGHDYQSAVWEWSDDNTKAKVTLTCSHDKGHTLTLEATVSATKTEGTDSTYTKTVWTASTTYDNKIYSDQKEEIIGTHEHKYSEKYVNTDPNYHWRECDCGAKTDEEKHTFGTDGVCTVCGCVQKIGDCDHKELTEKTLDIGKVIGRDDCYVTIVYQTCSCGKVKVLNIDKSKFDCELEEVGDAVYGKDENGYETESQHWKCVDCGLEADSYLCEGMIGCTEFMRGTYSFYYNGETIIEDVYFEQTYESHYGEYVTLNLADYGACGGTVRVRKCNDCGEIYDFYLDYLYTDGCDIDLNVFESLDNPTETTIDSDGNEHKIYRASCSKCGLTVTGDICTEIYSVCESKLTITLTLSCGDTKIAETIDTDSEEDHDYTKTITFKDETLGCEGGYTVVKHCTKCGDEYKYSGEGHNTDYVEIDLAEKYGACSGSIDIKECVNCGKQFYSYFNKGCGTTSDKTITDDDGTIHRIYTTKCNICNLTFIRDYASKYTDECNYTTVTKFQIISNSDGEVLFEMDGIVSENSDHNYEIKEWSGSCDDRLYITYVCTRCGETYTSKHWGHCHEYEEISLDEYGVCSGSYIREYKCIACGDIEDRYVYLNCCLNGDDVTCVCDNCGISRTEIYTKGDYTDSCTYTYTSRYTYAINDVVIYEYTEQGNEYEHEYEYTYTYNDEEKGCEGGYSYRAECTKCGDFYNGGGSEHRYNNEDRSLADYGMCGGYLHVQICEVCGDTEYYYVDDQVCNWVDSDDGSCKYCENCGIKKICIVTKTKDPNCIITTKSDYTYYKGDQEILSFTEYSSNTDHTYVYEFELNGDDCENGVDVTERCKDCGYEYSYTTYSHETFPIEDIDLEDYGVCYGYYYIYSCACKKDVWYGYHFCANYDSWNTYKDDLGRTVEVTKYVCGECGLTFTHTWYTERDSATCTSKTYYTDIIYIGNTLISEISYTEIGDDAHNYTVTGSLNAGSTTCEDGVTVTYTCKDCGYAYTEEYDYCYTFVTEVIDLSQFGNCGGFAYIYNCACGCNGYLELDGSFCDLEQYDHISPWITGDNIIESGWHFVSDHDYYFEHDCYHKGCSVTNDADGENICGLEIKYAEYWVWDRNNCKAYKYNTYIFYNERTGVSKEFTFKCGERDYHNYTYTEQENGSYRYDCSNCGSYYTHEYTYKNGSLVKEYTQYENKLTGYRWYSLSDKTYTVEGFDSGCHEKTERHYGDGKDYVDETIYGYLDGCEYTIFHYYTEKDYWRKYEYTYDFSIKLPFGNFGYKMTEVTTGSGDYNETWIFNFVHYKNHQFTTYKKYIDGDYWKEYVYTYTFGDGCYRTTEYTDSYGDTYTRTDNVCEFYDSSKVIDKKPTCTQHGYGHYVCNICGCSSEPYEILPECHSYVQVSENLYYCFTCGMESITGQDGDVVLEDLSGDDNFIVGYWNSNRKEFTYYVSLILGDGTEILLDGVDFIFLDDINAISFSKAQVKALAEEMGYTDESAYNVRFTFVPYDNTGSFDYAVTFAPTSQEIGKIIGSTVFKAFVEENGSLSLTIEPTQNGVWTFRSVGYGYVAGHLYDSNKNIDIYDYHDFYIECTLNEGETYTLDMEWQYVVSGYMYIVITFEPTNA